MSEHDSTCEPAVAEEWRPVVGYEGLYEVSSLGRIRRSATTPGTYRGRILSAPLDANGYPRLGLCANGNRKSLLVHRIVALAFLGEPPRPEASFINHKNCDKTDSRPGNLEWVSPLENSIHASVNDRLVGICGESHCHAKLTNEQVIEIRRLKGSASQAKIAKKFGVSQTLISNIHLGRAWPHLPMNEST